jgi:hypothetical protein
VNTPFEPNTNTDAPCSATACTVPTSTFEGFHATIVVARDDEDWGSSTLLEQPMTTAAMQSLMGVRIAPACE